MAGLTLTPVSRDQIPQSSTRPSSESAQLFQGFMDSDAEVVAVAVEVADGEDAVKKVNSVRSTLGNYIERHDIPVNLFTRNGSLYMEKITPEAHTARKAALAAKRAAKAEAAPAEATSGEPSGDAGAEAATDLG